MDIRVRRAARSWTVCKYTYISEVNIRSLRHPCRESDSSSTHWRCVRWSGRAFLSRRSRWNHCSRLQEALQFATSWASSCPAATRYKLTPQQSIPTTACSAVVRESQCGQVWQFGAYHRSSHVGSLALTYNTVWSRSGRSSTRVMPIARASMSVLPGARARLTASLACAPVTPLYCGVLFFGTVWCIMQCWAAAQNYAAAPTQPISFATAAPQAAAMPSWLEIDFFSISMLAPYPSSRPSDLFSLGSRLPSKKLTFCLDRRGKGLASGFSTRPPWL